MAKGLGTRDIDPKEQMREGRLARTIRRDFLEEVGQSWTLNKRKGKEKEVSFYFFFRF